MLTNYVKDINLQAYHPQLSKQLWAGKTNYEAQIDEAFSRVMVDLNNKHINVRLLMKPLYLTDGYTALALSTTGSSSELNDFNLKRFVVDVTAIDGTHTVEVEGSDDGTNWFDVASMSIAVVGTHDIEYTQAFKYWRYVFTLGTGTGATIRCSLVENIWDKLIIYKAFTLIFSDFRKEEKDSWDMLVQQYERAYLNYLDSSKFMYDANDSGSIDEDDYASLNYVLYL